MTPERWQHVKELFEAALARTPSERQKFLVETCGADMVLRREVQSLLSSFDDAESFMEQPAVEKMAQIIIGDSQQVQKGERVGHYLIIRMLGAGGMGEVYLAEDTTLNQRKVALKFLPAQLTADRERLGRFEQEATTASAINHPNILTIYEFGQAAGVRFIAAEYVDGVTLRTYLSAQRLKLTDMLDIATQIAAALDAAHHSGIVHRDIKPENVMVRADSLVKVLDFGLAKLTEKRGGVPVDREAPTRAQVQTTPGVRMGTVAYMSPEQARGKEIDARTDVWSLGVVLYEMLSGRVPFAGETTSDTIAAILKIEPAPLEENTPPELHRIMRKALQKKADERYQTVKDLLLDLKHLKRELEFSEELERAHIPPRAKSAEVGTAQASENATAMQPAANSTQGGLSQQPSIAEHIAGEVRKHKFVSLSVLAALIVALAAIGYFLFFAPPSAAINSIAVMPFVNASQDANNEYLSDGITENLINNLSQIPKLKVMSRNSVFYYKGKETNAQKIGQELNVSSVLQGNMRQIGDRIIVNVELINAGDNVQIWGKQYAYKLSDIITTQNEIAREVVGNLRLKLNEPERQELNKRPTDNAEAYQLYLKGRFLQSKATPNDAQKASECFQQAIALDPNFALAYVGLARAYADFSDFKFMPPREYMPKAREFTLKALSLDDQLPAAHVSLGDNVLFYDYDFTGAEREYKRAIELNPNYAVAHIAYGNLLANLGRREESFAELRRGLELDPISLSANTWYGYILFLARRYDEAIAQFKRTLELDANYFPPHSGLALAYEMKGDYAASIAERVKLNELIGAPQRAELIQRSFAEGGWQGFLRMVTDERQPIPFPSQIVAASYAELGEKDKAFAFLNKLYNDRDSTLVTLKVDPRLDSLRDDPRFQDLLRRVGFMP